MPPVVEGDRLTAVMQGVRILEVAEHTFVPAASALLADWGAEVIKIEHVERGDAMRGLASSGTVSFGEASTCSLEHSNRGKKSLGARPDVRRRARRSSTSSPATCDVFLTNKLPSVRTKLKIDVDDIRAHNPKIIYVRGTGQGEHGPDADQGSYDSLAYWDRSGVAIGIKHAGRRRRPRPPGPAFGDSIGAMTIAGGIMGALFHRERTGEATTVDVSLLGVGIWSMGARSPCRCRSACPGWPPPGGSPPATRSSATTRPADGRFVSSDLSAGREVLAGDVRSSSVDRSSPTTSASPTPPSLDGQRRGRRRPARRGVRRAHRRRVARASSAAFSGQWTMVQDTLEVAVDPQTVANDYIQDYDDLRGRAVPARRRRRCGSATRPPTPKRAPEFNEHGDEILESIGLDWDAIIDLKVRGVVA